MSFPEAARRLGSQISDRRTHVQTEEAVKQALILPFVQLLGFDIYDPREVIPEYRAGWAKQTEKIDYALAINGALAIFIEAKGPNEVLSSHDPQLAKYFNSTPEVKFAIITNGVQYRFFTDLQEPNLLDKKPFFEFDAERITDADIAILERFRKETFNAKSLVTFAEELVYLTALKSEFRRLLREPSDEFIRFTIKSAGLIDGMVTQKVVDRFRPLVKEGVSAAILEIVGQSFQSSAPVEEADTEAVVAAEANLEGAVSASREPVTTAEELEAFRKICEMVAPYVPDPSRVCYRDTLSYCSVQYGVVTRWFARLFIQDRDKKAVVVRISPDRLSQLTVELQADPTFTSTDASRFFIEGVTDLAALEQVLVEAAKQVV